MSLLQSRTDSTSKECDGSATVTQSSICRVPETLKEKPAISKYNIAPPKISIKHESDFQDESAVEFAIDGQIYCSANSQKQAFLKTRGFCLSDNNLVERQAKQQCFACREPLLRTFRDIVQSLQTQDRCLYKCHVHPISLLLLSKEIEIQIGCTPQLPTCALCLNRTYAIEQEVTEEIIKNQRKSINQPKKSVNKNVSACSLCARRVTDEDDNDDFDYGSGYDNIDEMLTRSLTPKEQGVYFSEDELDNDGTSDKQLYLCDFCPRSYCRDCLIIWNKKVAGSRQGPEHEKFSFIMQDDDGNLNDLPWTCIICLQDQFRTSSQNFPTSTTPTKVQSLSPSNLNGELAVDFSNQVYSSLVLLDEEDTSKEALSTEQILDLLREYEDDLETVFDQLEFPSLHSLYNDICQELGLEDANMARMEILKVRRLLEDHAARIQEEIPIIQELLKTREKEDGFTLEGFYKARQEYEKESPINEEARQSAEKEIQERDKAMGLTEHNTKGASGYEPSNPYIYDLDIFRHEASDSDNDNDLGSQFDEDAFIVDDLQSLSDAVNKAENYEARPNMPHDTSRIRKKFLSALKSEDRIMAERLESAEKKLNELESNGFGNGSRKRKRMIPSIVVKTNTELVDSINDEDWMSDNETEPIKTGTYALSDDIFNHVETKDMHEVRKPRQLRPIGFVSNQLLRLERAIASKVRRGIKSSKDSLVQKPMDTNQARKKRRLSLDKIESIPYVYNHGDKLLGSDVAKHNALVQSQTFFVESRNEEHTLYDPKLCGMFGVDDSDSEIEILGSPSSGVLEYQIKVPIRICRQISDNLKQHQKDGIKFMWTNICGTPQATLDLPYARTILSGPIKGCILAHNMGLGKSLQTVALLHTLLCHPGMDTATQDGSSKTDANDKRNAHVKTFEISKTRMVQRVVLCVPKNVLANWEEEFKKWTGSLDYNYPLLTVDPKTRSVPKIPLHCPGKPKDMLNRIEVVRTWHKYGGILLLTFDLYRAFSKFAQESNKDRNASDNIPAIKKKTPKLTKQDEIIRSQHSSFLAGALLSPGPDVFVIDEAHEALKNRETQKSKAFNAMDGVCRRIGLTGTPFQNNLNEYYTMANWARPGCLGTPAEFEEYFVQHIMNGLNADSTPDQVQLQEYLTTRLYRLLEPFVHRRDSNVLANELPFMQQAVLVVRQSKVQGALYRLYKRAENKANSRSLVEHFGKVRLVFNHPGALLLTENGKNVDLDEVRSKFKNNAISKPVSGSSFEQKLREEDKISLQRNQILGLPMRRKSLEDLRKIKQELKTSTNQANSVDLIQNASKFSSLNQMDFLRKYGAEASFLASSNNTGTRSGLSNQGETTNSFINNLMDQNADIEANITKHNFFNVSQAVDIYTNNRTTITSGADDDVIELLDSEDEEEGVTEGYTDQLRPAKRSKNQPKGTIDPLWWLPVLSKVRNLSDMQHGGKMIILLQILAHADSIGDKVVVFSQSLLTLNFIESVLNTKEWEKLVPEIARICPGRTFGPWRKNKEYMRIDGAVDARSRGSLVQSFGNDESGAESKFKVFLLTTKAGGVGINLVAANRVVILDSSWNPAIDLQALYRCYRYGQKKPVFAYRLLAEGTMEEKIYSRQVNKTGLSKRVIDQDNPARHFTDKELSNLMEYDTWVQCEECGKWRMLPPNGEVDEEQLPDYWTCSMNVFDPDRSSCDARERNHRFYLKLYTKGHATDEDELAGTNIDGGPDVLKDDISSTEKEAQTARDAILKEIVDPSEDNEAHEESQDVHGQDSVSRFATTKKGNRSWISKYHFHDALLIDDTKAADIHHIFNENTREISHTIDSQQSLSQEPLGTQLNFSEMQSSDIRLHEEQDLESQNPLNGQYFNNSTVFDPKQLERQLMEQTFAGRSTDSTSGRIHNARQSFLQTRGNDEVIELLSSDED